MTSAIENNRIVVFISTVSVTILTFVFMRLANKGKKFYVRRVAGVDMMDEALDRATEMGGSVNFCVGDVAGLSGTYVSQTIAGFECLSYIAKHCAKLRTKLIVSTIGRGGSGGDLVPVQNDIVRDAYAEVGHEEDFTPQIIRYLGGDREGYETGFYDLYVKDKVTTNVFIGAWAGGMPQPTIIAKDLGIIHISGTARPLQMSLQAVMSDYFMIAEEMYAAGAYLGGEAIPLATIAMTDYVKYALVAILILGTVAMWAGSDVISKLLLY